MAALRSFFTGIGLVVFFSLCLFIFMTSMITLNNPSSTVLNDSFVNQSTASLQASTASLQQVSSSANTLLTKAEPSPVYLFLILKAAFDIPIGLLSFMITGIGSVFSIVFTSLFGPGPSPFYIVFGVVGGIIILTIVLVILRGIRTGDTER